MSTHENISALRMPHADKHKKTALAASIALTLGGLGLSTSAMAALPSGTLLNFTAGSVFCLAGGTPPNNCTYGASDVTGSYFTMDSNGDGISQAAEKTPIAQNNGLIIGSVQPASGSHTGPANGSESPGIDQPWGFFKNTGMHFTSSAVSTLQDIDTQNQTLDFSGWNVTWNGIPAINMGGGLQDCGTASDGICVDNNGIDVAGTADNGTGIATFTCPVDCATNNNAFAMDYAAVVPLADPSGFGGVPYTVHMEGTITLPGEPPTANDDSAATIAANPITISVQDNDTAPAGDPVIPASSTVSTPAGNGTTDDTDLAGTITYTPNVGPDFVGIDTFGYTIANGAGTSNAATVTVTVTANQAPQANNDTTETSTAVLDATAGQIANINVLANDTDANNPPGQPGGIDTTTVTIVSDATVGSCTANGDGTITYTQAVPSQGVTESCTYRVSDLDPVNGALLSNDATLTITVTATESDWDPNLPSTVIPLLQFEPGIPTPDQSIKPQKSYFSMQVSASTLIYTAMEPGPDGGFVIGYDQPASGSHTSSPNGTEQPGFSAPWVFFTNTGFDLTRNGGITGNPDGTLDFFNKYVVTWNGIPTINLGGSSQFPEDLGFATIVCSDKPCQNGSTFTLDYAAHVEDVAGLPASGFNGVPYTLHLEGTVVFLDAALSTSAGTIASESRVSIDDPGMSVDTEVDQQCVGGCFDYTIDSFTAGSKVSIVLPLAGGVPNNPVWRILDNGTWRNFDTSAGDAVKSAPAVAGAGGLVCPAAGDPAYVDLGTGSVGDKCIQLSITDNGLNDLDPTDSVISDPSGLGGGGSAGGGTTFVDTRTSDTSGCSIAATTVNPAQRADWWLLAGLIGLLGWVRKRCQH